jgi:transposase InsO family protein
MAFYEYPPSIAVGDSITFDGAEHIVLGLEEQAALHSAVALRLRDSNGACKLVLASAVYADLAAQTSGGMTQRPSGPLDKAQARTAKKAKKVTRDHPEQRPGSYLGLPFDPSTEPAPLHAVTDPDDELVSGHATHSLERSHDHAAALESLPQAALDRAIWLEHHIREFTYGYPDPVSDQPVAPRPGFDPEATTLENRVRAKSAELGMSRATLFKKRKAWLSHGLWGLVDGRSKRISNPLRGLDQRIIDAILAQAVAERGQSTGTWKRFRGRLELRLAATAPGLKLPPDSTLRPKVEFLLAGQYTFSDATTRRTHDLKPEGTYVHMRADRPGQVVLMDATKFDARAYDPVNDVNVRVQLNWAVDLATRSPLAWRLTPQSIKGVDAALLLADMIRPEPMRPHWQEELSIRLLGLPMGHLINHDERFAAAAAKPVILAETLLVDNDKVNVSDAFRTGCELLGINHQTARVMTPTDKAAVEASFRTLGARFTQHIAGYTGPNPAKNGRDSEKQARWTIAELEEFLAYYIVAIYQRTPHSALVAPWDAARRMTPNQAYAVAVTRCGWVAAPVADDLYYQLLPLKWVKIHPYGVNLNYRVHDDKILREYENASPEYVSPLTSRGRRAGIQHGQRKKKSKTLPVHYDPRDLRYAYFYAWNHHAWYGLPWVDAPDDIQPITDTYYRTLRRYMRDNKLNYKSSKAIADALSTLQRAMDAKENWTARSRREQSVLAERAREAARDRAASALLANEEELAKPRRARANAQRATSRATAKRFDIDVTKARSLRVVGSE